MAPVCFLGISKVMDVKIFLDHLALGPKLIVSLARSASLDQYDSQPESDRFSFRADVAHLCDIESFFRKRLRALAENPRSEIVPIDIDRLPGVEAYESSDPVLMATQFLIQREDTIQLCQSLPVASFSHIGEHPDLGEMSLLDVIHYMIGHDLYHAEHMAKIISVRKPG